MIKNLTLFVLPIILLIIFLIVCFSPMALVYYLGYPELDSLSRFIGCLIAIPMLKWSFNVIDYVVDKWS